MATFVLVHGGFHGGWVYRQVAALLRREGHDVYTPTLTGLGERSHLLAQPINLETHITDIVNVLQWEDLEDVVLLGHSYGGMVITGVADRVPERISALVYLDALSPENGNTLFTLRPEYLDYFMGQVAAGGGLSVSPGPASSFDAASPEHQAWIDAKATAHPFACFIQSIALTGGFKEVRRKLYVYASGGICEAMYQPFRSRDDAEVIAVDRSGHSIMLDQPEKVAEILIGAAQPS